MGLIVAGMVICEVVSALTLTVLCRWRLRRTGVRGPGEPGRVRRRRIFSIALPVGLNALLGNLMGAVNAALVPQKLVDGGMEPSQAISELGVVCGMTLPMLALPTVFLSAMSLVLVPRLARSHALDRPQAVRHTISRALSAGSVLALPAMGLMAVLGEDLGLLLFRHRQVGEYLLPLAAATALGCYQAILGASLNGVGRQGTVAWISLVCDAVQLLLTACLVGNPRIGMGGFVLGVLVSAALGVVLCAWRLRAFTGLRLRLFRWIAAPGLSALLAALVTNLLYRVLRDSGLPLSWRIPGALAFGLVLYLAALSAQGVTLRGLFHLE